MAATWSRGKRLDDNALVVSVREKLSDYFLFSFILGLKEKISLLGRSEQKKICACLIKNDHIFIIRNWLLQPQRLASPKSAMWADKLKTQESQRCRRISKAISLRTCLVVQRLRLLVLNAGGPGSIPGQGTRSHMLQRRGHMPQLKEPACPN